MLASMQNRLRALAHFAAGLAMLVVWEFAQTAELRLNVSGSYRSLDIEGPIEPGDYDRFLRIAKENQGQLSGVALYSAGGDFVEAMKIGRALRALEISSQVPQRGRDGRPVCEEMLGSKPRDPSNCTAGSAAFFIHIGGTHRGGTYLAVHRPYFDPQRFRSLSQEEARVALDQLLAEARKYMAEMAIPSHIQEEVLSTPSDKFVLLDERQVRTHIWGDLPHRHEWRRAKCAKLSAADTQRLGSLGARIVARERLAPEEVEELTRFQSVRDQEMKCDIALTMESRLAAYERFFGEAPSDATAHNFSKWLDAPKYLGRSFEDLASEERFEPERALAGTSSLLRRETATSPSASVMDLGNKRKLVSWVSIAKEQPSKLFRERVRKTLEASWGPPQGSEDSLHWTTETFRARLLYETRASRPGLILVVERPPPR
jgi:hypothetical protein